MFHLRCNFHFLSHLKLLSAFTGFQRDKMRLLNWLRCLVLLLFLGTVYLMFLPGSSTPQSECECFLPCDASKFAGHTFVIYRLKSDIEQRVAVSDFVKNGKCIVRVPKCTEREKPFSLYLLINAADNKPVSEKLFSRSYPEPVCEPEKATNERSVNDGVAILSGNLLLMFMCLLLFM